MKNLPYRSSLNSLSTVHDFLDTSEAFEGDRTSRVDTLRPPSSQSFDDVQRPWVYGSAPVSANSTVIDVTTANASREANGSKDKGLILPEELSKLRNQATPETKVRHITRLRTWFTPYRQLFVVIFVINIVGFAFNVANRWPWASRNETSIVVGNVLAAIAFRNEWFLRFLYWLVVKSFRPKWFPVVIRARVVGILYHIGGVHSGCGVAAMLWLVAAVEHHFQHPEQYHPVIYVTLACCAIGVFLCCLAALPIVRGPNHNTFEVVHRFVGWVGVLLTFLFVILSSAWDVGKHEWDTSTYRLVSHPELWFLVAIIGLILSSWITTTKVPVIVYTSSGKASVIRVPGGLTSGLHTRISRGGLREWHIFGSISEGKKADCHYIVAAVQGSFTKALNVDKPSTLYTKSWKPCGLPYFSRLFNRGVAICTGSGIGAVGSTCIQHKDWFLIWIGADLEKTYGRELLSLIEEKITPERRLIWDTRSSLGRPNVVQLLRSAYFSWGAEVALFIGSPTMNKTVLETSRELNLPVFGSIWDA